MFLFSKHSEAQTLPSQFYFKHLKTEQGLSNGIINDILIDQQGFMWMGTYNGLNCFDGSHFKIWKAEPSQTGKLNSNIIHALCEGDNGNIWCATDAGISRYNRYANKFVNYKLIQSVSGIEEYGTTLEVIKTRKGEIITQSKNGIYIYDPIKDKFIHYAEKADSGTMPFDFIVRNSFVEDPFKNGIWFGSNAGLYYFDLKSKRFYNQKNNPDSLPFFNDHYISPVVLDRNNRLVFADFEDQAIYTYDFKTKFLEKKSYGSWQKNEQFTIASIFIDEDNNKWISTINFHLYFEDGVSGEVTEFKNEPTNIYSIAANSFYDGCQDKDGTIYFATVNGVSAINMKNNFFSIVELPEIYTHSKKYYFSFLLNGDQQNNLWLCPSYKYALKYNPNTGQYTKYDFLPRNKNYNPEGVLISSMEASADNLYFGTMDGLYVYNVKSDHFNKMVGLPDSLGIDGKYILMMQLTSKNELWFTSHHNGVFYLDLNTGKYHHYIHDQKIANSFSDDYIFDIHESANGDIWFCAENDGLIRFNRSKDDFEYLVRDSSFHLPRGVYLSMTSDRENNLWLINMLEGVLKYNPKTKTTIRISSDSNVSNLNYNHIITDKDNTLWMAYYYQFTNLDAKSLVADNFEIDYAKGTSDYVNRFCRLQDGRIISETFNGFILFDGVKKKIQPKFSPVTISGFVSDSIFHPFLNAENVVVLQLERSDFSIDFSTLNYFNNHNIRFSYKLEGVDDNWVDCGSRQSAYYSNLPGGDYTFSVRVMGPNGKWLPASSDLKISVTKIFYSTIWFKLLLLGLLFICSYWYFRIWKSKQVKAEADKAISYFANSMQGKNRVEEILWDIANNIMTHSNFVDCVIYVVDEERRVLVQKAAVGNKQVGENDIYNPLEIPFGSGIVGFVAINGRPEIVNDTSIDPRYISDDLTRLSEIAVPVIYEGKVIAVIDSEHPSKHFYTAQHLRLLTTIASISSTKIINAKKELEITEKEARLGDLKTQMAFARQQALRAQMNPHFIFNCLNSINGFILKNEAAIASTYLIKFAKLIRLILENSNERSITLQHELDALKLYIDMEAIRFGGKFTAEIKVDRDVEVNSVMLPPLIFQPYVENSIWHGLLHKETEGKLLVHIKQIDNFLVCIIEDDGVGRLKSAELKASKPALKKSLGLKLTQERLNLMKEQERRDFSIEMEDLWSDNGNSAGTRVIIRIESEEHD